MFNIVCFQSIKQKHLDKLFLLIANSGHRRGQETIRIIVSPLTGPYLFNYYTMKLTRSYGTQDGNTIVFHIPWYNITPVRGVHKK